MKKKRKKKKKERKKKKNFYKKKLGIYFAWDKCNNIDSFFFKPSSNTDWAIDPVDWQDTLEIFVFKRVGPCIHTMESMACKVLLGWLVPLYVGKGEDVTIHFMTEKELDLARTEREGLVFTRKECCNV